MACNLKADMPSLDIFSDRTKTASVLYLLCVICSVVHKFLENQDYIKSKFYKNKDTKIILPTKYRKTYLTDL
jgi:hypothetical protein